MSTSVIVLVAVLAAALVSLAGFALRPRQRDHDAAKRKAQFLSGAGDFVLDWFLWVLSPLVGVSLRAGLTPDAYNVLGLAFGAASGLLIGFGQLELGGWAVAAGGICDIMDGRLARAKGISSRYGEFIDSTLDRFVESFAFLGLVVFLRGFLLGPVLAAGALAGSALVSYTRARGQSLGVDCTGGLARRAERLVLVIGACLADGAIAAHLGRPPGTVVLWVLVLLNATAWGTAVYRTVWISRRLLRDAPS
jgi:CDP-diacylglycerol---glycerol-3-phosphate 3-phosphatidyltransferase